MRLFTLAFLVFGFFSGSLGAITIITAQGGSWDVQPRKWTDSTVFVYGKPYPVKAFISVDEKCRDQKGGDMAYCYKDFSALPEKSEVPSDNEIDTLSDQGVRLRVTKDVFCTIQEARISRRAIAPLPCDEVWDYIRQQQ